MNIFNLEEYSPFRKFIGEGYKGYIRFYSKADLVLTNRIHTFLICMLFGVPCRLYLAERADYHRYFLFHTLGVQINHGRLYDVEDYKPALEKVEVLKKVMFNALNTIL